jgi:hypothetical protein
LIKAIAGSILDSLLGRFSQKSSFFYVARIGEDYSMGEVGDLKGLIILLILGTFVNSSCLSSQAGIKVNGAEPIMKVQKMVNLEPVDLSADPMEVTVSISRLICRERLSSPSGVANQPDRDIGFALVLINLENLQEISQTVTIQEVSIRNSSDGRPQSFSFVPRVISLHPLEHAAVDIHLSNQIGYGAQSSMIAVVTYGINGQSYVVQSENVDVDRT